MKNIGVLAFHGDVSEHIAATRAAAQKRRDPVHIIEVRTKRDLEGLAGLIIPGGESTTLQKLCERESMFPLLKKVKNIFGTCAGAILLAKDLKNKQRGQKTLQLMNITVARNAYGRQIDSAVRDITTPFGNIRATFIRAPKIVRTGSGVTVLAKDGEDILCCGERRGNTYYLATTFHPELTTSAFHEYFLEQIS